MKFYWSPTSPFVRKVSVTARELGLFDRLTVIPTRVDPTAPDTAYAAINPYMKVPSLVTDDGLTLFGSSVICQYLDTLHDGPPLVPHAGRARWETLRLEAIADGLLEAAVLVRSETLFRPPERRHAPWLDGQVAKVSHGLALLESWAPRVDTPLTLGHLAVGCALGWLEFRQPVGDPRPACPALFAWYDRLRVRPSFTASMPVAS